MDRHFHRHLTTYTNPNYVHLANHPPLSVQPQQQVLETSGGVDRERERLPQWTHAETSEFLSIRAELDHSFLATKRNKALWEAIAARLRDKGFARTPDQCKSKWKNLVTRFKGSEAMEQELAGKQFPFHEEMKRIFAARMEKGKEVQVEGGKEWDDDGEEEEEGGEEEKTADRSGGKKKRRVAFEKRTRGSAADGEVEAALREFMRRQLEMEDRWMEAAEAREAERRAREVEWRSAMLALGEERLAMARRWSDREEEWRARAEARAERRHQLVAALLAKLGDDGL